ncbi:MAG: AAA family ATPase [Acidimicrobiales bacterium]
MTIETGADNTGAAIELERVLFEIKKVIVGQDHMVERLLVALLARGHILLEGLPGLAKTLAVSTMARAIGGSFVRLQFTPDLLPSDLVGTRIWRASTEQFDIEWGPVFANLLLTDEINRAPAKVQSALLEVMAERQVSIGGQTRPLPKPFLVLATQNPIESEGVYTLPEAQRDRFLMKVTVDYPSPTEELEIVRRVGVSMPEASEVMDLQQLESLQRVADQVYVDNSVAQYAVDLVMATREPGLRGMPELEPLIDFGVSPRATLGLVAASRALAVLRGRSYVVPQDTFDVARDVLRHRIMLSYEALAKGLGADDILNRLLTVVPAASVSPVEMARVASRAADYATVATPAIPAPTPAPSPIPAPGPGPSNAQPPMPPAPTGSGADSENGSLLDRVSTDGSATSEPPTS